MFSIFYGIASALSWGVADFAGGIAARKFNTYRVVFYGNALGLLVLCVVVALYPEPIPEIQSLILAGLAGMFASISSLVLFHSMTGGKMSIAAPVSALFAAAIPIVVGISTEGLPRLSHKNFTCLSIDSRVETESVKFSMAA